MIKILIAPSCYGKTTYSKQFVQENKNWYIVSRDIERESLFGVYRMGNQKEEKIVSRICREKTNRLLEARYNVILDSTHLKESHIKEHINNFNHLTDIELVLFEPIGKEELIRRNQKRFLETGKLIPENVLHKQLKNLELLNLENTFYPKTQIEPNQLTGNDYLIVDIDGTLSSSNHRDIFDPKPEQIILDKVIQPTGEIVKLIANTSDKLNVIFLSGRSDKFFDVTLEWLVKKVGIINPTLHMRKEGDYRKDWIIKEEIVKNKLEGLNIIGVIDDRQQMLDYWTNKGYFLFDVGQSKAYF